MTGPVVPAGTAEDEPSIEELEELEMELELQSFEQSLPDDVELRDTHRIAFRAGWQYRKDADSKAEQPLTFHAFSEMNRVRCESPRGFNHKLESWSLSDWFTAILGELGEAANVAKKLNRVRDGIPGNKETEAELRQNLRREIADTFIYLDLTAQAAGFQLIDAVLEVFHAKSKEIERAHET